MIRGITCVVGSAAISSFLVWNYFTRWEIPRQSSITLNAIIEDLLLKQEVDGRADVLFYFNVIEFHGDIRSADLELLQPIIKNQPSWLKRISLIDTRITSDEVVKLKQQYSPLEVIGSEAE